MTPEEFAELAPQWGSYISVGDPGACMYGFRFGDGAVQNEDHRRACIAWLTACLRDVPADLHGELRDMIAYLRDAPVRD